MNRRRAEDPAPAPPIVGSFGPARSASRVVAALLGLSLPLAIGCGGGITDPVAPRQLTIDRPNAPFAEPDAIRGVAPLANSAAATASSGSAQKARSVSRTKADVATTPPPTVAVANALPASAKESTSGAMPGEVQIIGQIVRGERARGAVIAEVDVDRCFQAIPSYRNLKGDRNSRDYARYLLSLTEANEEFRIAVEGIALRDGYDLVVEKGGVRGARTVDITDAVCERLSEQKATIAR